MKPLLLLGVIAWAALASSLCEAAPQSIGPSLRALVGAPVTDVRAALGFDDQRAWAPGLRIADPAGEVALYTVATEPWVVLSDNPREGERVCRAVFGRPGPTGVEAYPDRSAELVLVFQRGRLTAALSSPLRPRVTDPRLSPAEAVKRAFLGPQPAPLSRQPGQLPLADGAAFLARRPELHLPSDTVFGTTCRPLVRENHNPGFDEAGFVQGLSLLPLAIGLPKLNRERVRARREGGAVLSSLRLGQSLPGGVEAFARGVRGAYVLRDADLAYGVLVVDLGAPPSRNVGRMNHAGLVGIRGDRVVWIGRTDHRAPLGLSGALCLDRNARPGRVRRGCSSTGYFAP